MPTAHSPRRTLRYLLAILFAASAATYSVLWVEHVKHPRPQPGFTDYEYSAAANSLKVGTVIPASPAALAGLRPGDQIVAIDGQKLENLRPFYEAIIVGQDEVVELAVEQPTSPGEQRRLKLNLARRRYQKGRLKLIGNEAESLVREMVRGSFSDGQSVRVRRGEVIGTFKDYPTKRLAQRLLDERLGVVNDPRYRARPTATFAEFATRWEGTVLGQLKASTALNYRVQLRKHLIPFFGKYQVKDMTPELVQTFVAQAKASPKTVRNICITLQSAWRTARAWQYVSHDIMEGVILKRPKKVQRFFFSAEEIHKIIAAAPEPYCTFYGLLAESGLRAGEICGLGVGDLNLEYGLLSVRHSAWRGRLGEPKNDDSVRVVELSPQAIKRLATFMKSWRPNERGLLFATKNGTPWDANMLLKRKFKPLLQSLGIAVPRGNGFHAFRHANATMMDRLGTPMKLRQARLGHEDGSPITQTIYSHVVTEDAKRVATQLGDAVWGKASATVN